MVFLFTALNTTSSAQGQTIDQLTTYISNCEESKCLDTLLTVDLQSFTNDTDKSKTLLKSALDKADSFNYASIIPKLINQLALIFYYQGAYDSSFHYRITGIKQLEEMEDWTMAGRQYAELGYQYKRINLDKGFEYMRKGIDLLVSTRDSIGLANAHNNFGVLHEMDHNLDSAMFYYTSSLNYKIILNDSLGIPYSLENIANIQIAQQSYKQAEDNLSKALQTRLEVNDQQGLLGNYINLAELYSHTKDYNKSISFFNKALQIEQHIGHPYAAQYCYEKITAVYRRLNQFENALDAHIQYSLIKDSISNVQNIKNVESLTIQYETEKKEKEIELLSVENQLKETEIQAANNRFFATAGTSGLILLSAFLFFNRYQHKQRALLAEEKANNQKLGFKSLIEGEEKERKRIAQELHDGLGQLLSTARLNVSAMEDRVENIVNQQWENSIKLIDEAVTEVRHISHNMMPNALISIGFEAAVKEQIHIINGAGKIHVHAHFPEEKLSLGESEAIALYRVIQEVLNNAIKYAEAKNIWLSITINGEVEISIKDDGKGFDTELIQDSRGIGWNNIKSRMEILNGEVRIKSKVNEGSEIFLKLAI
ncbi:tetratricopeptide repeat-containing sensor histidine kinase [Reichenbachiella sp.]|uniref:tetratricopeptide repeat-containing sensor histidine kinase n=1 Tax=Reichenbachiella sp. TaxID=2184521 RepID=UPI003B5C5611